MKRRNSINAEQYLLKQWTVLSKNQLLEIQSSFKKTEQREGGISFYDLINILKGVGFAIDQARRDKINDELRKKQIKVIDINVVLNQASSLKRQTSNVNNEETHEKNQYLNAFVALGGSMDKTGLIKKTVLINIIKKQFQLTFDIQSLLDSVAGEYLDYESFCDIFQKDKQLGQGRLASVASRASLSSSQSQRQLVVNDKDFQRFLIENHDS